MPIVLAVLAAIVGIALYVYLSILAFIFIAMPLSMVGVVLGLLVGAGIALYRATAVLVGTDQDTPVRTPAEVVAGKLAGRVPARQIRRDFAWPNYFFVQVRLDLWRIGLRSAATVEQMWVNRAKEVVGWDYRVLLCIWPLLLAALAFLLGVAAGNVMILLVLVVVFGLVTGLAWLLGLLAVGLLRAFDHAWQKVFRAHASCPRCYAVTDLPAYRCPGQHPRQGRHADMDLHRNIRPGRLGVLWRVCGCGRRLPTTVLRASRVLSAQCPTCGQKLHKGAAVSTDVRIPVFGAASAGKTHLIMSALVALLRAEPGNDTSVSLADEHAERMFRGYARTLDSGGSAPKTDASQQPIAVTVRMQDGRRRWPLQRRRSTLMHVFDAAGEALSDPVQNARYAYLDNARTLAYVLDPFSIPGIRDSYAANFTEIFAAANAAAEHPELSYQTTAQRLRDHGVRTKRQRLAFVVSKSDLLARLPMDDPPGTGSTPVRSWLIDNQLDNLVKAAERDFDTVAYFLVSAMGTTYEGGAFEPFRWLLADEPVRMPDIPTPEPPAPLAGRVPGSRAAESSADPAPSPGPGRGSKP
jgi:hypothetical protein